MRSAGGRPRRGEGGQAIVLIAFLIMVLCGMLGLAIDGGRLYIDRRELQDAVDGAVLAAVDNYLNSQDFVQAETASANVYASNERIYTTRNDCGFATPTLGTTQTFSCTWSGNSSQTFQIAVTNTGNGSGTFQATGQHRLPLTVMSVFGVGTTAPVSATAVSIARATTVVPALLTLSQDCSTSLLVSGSTSSLTITGNLVSDGGIAAQNGDVIVAGNTSQACSGTPPVTAWCTPSATAPPCTSPNVLGTKTGSAGNTPDPGFAPPTVSNLPTGTISNLLTPGTYAGTPTSGCTFVTPGIYDWTGGMNAQGDFVSNELKPPDEPAFSSGSLQDATRSTSQFWDTQTNCSGSFTLSTYNESTYPVATGQWAIELTAVRTETYHGVSFTRESAPSMCRTVSVTSGKGITVNVNNVPGAQAYDVYAEPPPGSCTNSTNPSTSFGYVGQFTNTAYGTGSLGSASANFNSTKIQAGFAPSSTAAADTYEAYAPDPETAPSGGSSANGNPASGTPPHGDRANEGQCATNAGVNTTCSSEVTPGAVIWYMPSGSCIDMTVGHGDIYLFSGLQYNWIVIYQPGPLYPPANTCTDNYAGHGNTTFIGITYMPSATLSITGNASFQAPVDGGVIAYSVNIGGNGGVVINSNGRTAPPAPAARLIQ